MGTLVVAYVAGLLTLPVVVLASVALTKLGGRGWTTHMDACNHGGPNTSRGRAPGEAYERVVSRWALRWRCDVIMNVETKRPCGGLWVRSWVVKLLPNRLLWPTQVRSCSTTPPGTG